MRRGAKEMSSGLDHRIPPPLVGLLLAIGMHQLARVTGVIALPSWLRWLIGGALVAIGLGFDLSGLIAFRRMRTTINPLRPGNASQLVVTGVYRLTRNPMYVGLVFLLAGWAAWLAAPLALIGPPLFIAYVTVFQIRPEERILGERFGEAYRDYLARVPRWL